MLFRKAFITDIPQLIEFRKILLSHEAIVARRQGIVSKLVSEAIDDLKAQGIRKILLHSSDMGKPMYESLGFVEGKNYMSINI
ncbi:GNAT family N-acetyltransferase [Paenibacillus sp. FSL F4-0125]|uniref:GNAT family N-acetyltransferase n=1 Tax=Paenibacillus sp. FSL F4-0125 TaxID=2954730 RepID=UPI0030FD1287